MLPILELIRLEERQQGTLGVLKINKEVFCATLEPPDRLNESFRSNIPAQQYMCQRYESLKFGSTFLVLDVPDREDIIFHPGNTVDDTAGCIILGQHWGVLLGSRAVLNSGQTFHAFRAVMDGHNKAHLTIKEVY